MLIKVSHNIKRLKNFYCFTFFVTQSQDYHNTPLNVALYNIDTNEMRRPSNEELHKSCKVTRINTQTPNCLLRKHRPKRIGDKNNEILMNLIFVG